MITIRLNGGLGNQMFQYAMGRALAFKYNKKLLLDIDEFDTYELRDFELNKYNIKAEIFTRKDNSNLNYKYHEHYWCGNLPHNHLFLYEVLHCFDSIL